MLRRPLFIIDPALCQILGDRFFISQSSILFRNSYQSHIFMPPESVYDPLLPIKILISRHAALPAINLRPMYKDRVASEEIHVQSGAGTVSYRQIERAK